MTIFPHLQDAIETGSLALFVGPDLTSDITGVPSHDELATDLGRRYGMKHSLSLAEVTQRIGRAGNRFEFTNYLRTRLDLTKKTPAPFHEELVSLVKRCKIRKVITTALDGLLELACEQAGLDIDRLIAPGDADFVRPDCPTVVKLCGDVQQPGTLVVTEQDHVSLLKRQNRGSLVDEVKYIFKHNTVLFIGLNAADAEFRLLLEHMRESTVPRLVYVIWPGLDPIDIRMWKDQGVVILDAPPAFLNLPSLGLLK